MKKVLLALASTVALATPVMAENYGVPTREGYINGYHVLAVDGGQRGTDLLVINGGQQDVAVNCNVTEEYSTYGRLNGDVVYGIVESWCGW